MRQYAADQIEVAFTGLSLTGGLSQGTFVQEGPVPPPWRQKGNGVGGVVYTFHPDRHSVVNVTLDASSREHAQMLAFYSADLATKSVVGWLRVHDTLRNEQCLWTKARILTRPPYAAGVRMPTYTWIIGFEKSFVQVIGLDRNVVGT